MNFEKCKTCLHKNVCGIKSTLENTIEAINTIAMEAPFISIAVSCKEYNYTRTKKEAAPVCTDGVCSVG